MCVQIFKKKIKCLNKIYIFIGMAVGIPTVAVPDMGYQKRLQVLKEKLDSVVRGSSATTPPSLQQTSTVS